MQAKGTLFFDTSGDHFALAFQAERILHLEHSAYQQICVFESKDLGRVLMLDEVFNVSTRMEAFYHEPMAHIPLAMIENPQRVLIIGGGDFGAAQHVLKHKEVRELILCELDPAVLEAAREFFPQWANAEKDPRLRVVVGDGYAFLRDSEPASFDAIIVDSTDPFDKAMVLAREEFYQAARRGLKEQGVLMQIVADGLIYRDFWPAILPRVKRHLTKIRPLFLPIPYYATGAWGLMLAGGPEARLEPGRVNQRYLKRIGGAQTLTPELVTGAFSLPPYLKTLFQDLDE